MHCKKTTFFLIIFFIGNAAAQCNIFVDDCTGTGSGTEANPYCTIQEAANIAKAGNVVCIKAGVYRESVQVKNSGNETQGYITFKAYPGDECKGAYGGTKNDCRVKIDGSIEITGTWARCQSAAECAGNPNWQDIYYISLPEGVLRGIWTSETGTQTFDAFFEDGVRIRHATEPDQLTPYFNFGVWNLNNYYIADSTGTTYLSDSKNLNQAQGFWVGGYVKWRDITSSKRFRKITASSAGTIQWENPIGITPDAKGYILHNHLFLLDQPGEFYVDYDSSPQRLYLMSRDRQNPQNHLIELSVKKNGFQTSPQSYVIVEGFEISKFYEFGIYIQYHYGPRVENIQARNNYVNHIGSGEGIGFGIGIEARTLSSIIKNLVIENNEVYGCGGTAINFGGSANAENIIVKANNLHFNASDGINRGGKNVLIAENKIYDYHHTDGHQDGMDLYYPNGDLNWIIRNNEVYDTTQNIYINPLLDAQNFDSSNIQIYGNLSYFTRDYLDNMAFSGKCFSIYAHAAKNIYLHNVDIHSNTFGTGPVLIVGNVGDIKVRNNLFYKSTYSLAEQNPSTVDSKYNLFYNIWLNDPNKADSLSLNTNPLLKDPENYDFQLTENSPAINAGDPNLASIAYFDLPFLDLAGIPRPQSSAFDIGAFEFPSGTECVGLQILMNYISQWKAGTIEMPVLMQKIALWKNPTGCN